jgi:hypothetical protein
VLFIRGAVLQDSYSLRLVSLLTERFLKTFADIIFSILANLIGLAYKKQIDEANIRHLVKLLTDAGWVPMIAQ